MLVPQGVQKRQSQQQLLDIIGEHCLTQVVDIPTHNDKTLDLLFTNFPSPLNRVKGMPPMGKADHDIVYVEYDIKAKRIKQASRKIYLYKLAGMVGLRVRHSELIVKHNIGLKALLQQGISEPIFYGDLVYKFKLIVGKPNFSDQFKKIVKRYVRIGYNLEIMRQSACLILNPIRVYSYGFLFNCMTVGQASDSMMAVT